GGAAPRRAGPHRRARRPSPCRGRRWAWPRSESAWPRPRQWPPARAGEATSEAASAREIDRRQIAIALIAHPPLTCGLPPPARPIGRGPVARDSDPERLAIPSGNTALTARLGAIEESGASARLNLGAIPRPGGNPMRLATLRPGGPARPTLALVLLATTALAACVGPAMPGPKTQIGAATGAAAGGLLGAAAGGKTTGILAGVLLGGLAGGAIGSALDAADRDYAVNNSYYA